MPTINPQNTWRIFIDAKKKLTALYEQPLATRGIRQQSSSESFSLELDQSNSREHFYKSLQSLHPTEKPIIDYTEGCFYLDWHTKITSAQLEQLSDVAAACYFDYDPQPFLSGSFMFSQDTSVDEFVADAQKNGMNVKLEERQNRIQFAPADYQKLKNLLKTERWNSVFRIPASFRISLNITPDYSRYLDRLLVESGLYGKVQIRNKRISEKDQRLKLKFKSDIPLTTGIIDFFNGKGFISGTEDDCYKFKSEFDSISYKPRFYEGHIKFKELLDEFRDVKLKLGVKNDYLIFNVNDTRVFDLFIKRLRELSDIRVFYRPDFTIASISPDPGIGLASLATQLETRFPGLESVIENNGRSVQFRYFMNFDERLTKRLEFINSADEMTNDGAVNLQLKERQRLAFVAKENIKLKAFQETERFKRLIGEEFCVGHGFEMQVFGNLQTIRFPYLVFARAMTEAQLNNLDLTQIRPNLRGEREKIERLNQTMDKLAGDAKNLPNPFSKTFVFDSSTARPVMQPDQLEENGAFWQEVEFHSYQPLNPSQTRAVLSTLLAPDLALVQGPPGTGKSTAISQIIWHQIRVKPKQQILLTSETNMAVDNAIEKLEHPVHNLVKPIRIGKESNLESEGSRYSLGRIGEWVKSRDDVTMNDNAVARWLPKLATRSKGNGLLSDDLWERWSKVLSMPPDEIRKKAADLYIQYCNVIASTGSYIGEINSEKKKTGFFRQYLQIAELRQSTEGVQQQSQRPKKTKISFDVVVMDEASKATPPELALPITYAKKAIIIGDHRQLPPLLDEEEFESILSTAGGADLAQEFLQNKEGQVSQFERLFLNPKLDPSLVSRFNRQYRMHPHINEVIKQFYTEDGGLECGIPDVVADDQDLSKPLSRFHGLQHDGFIEPNRHLLWVNVDEPEMKEGSSRINFSEVEAVKRVLNYLQNSHGFEQFQNSWKKPEEREIGLISFYGKQLFYLDQLRQELNGAIPLRVRTVDRFQGMERNIIIVSMVRSNKIISSRHQKADLQRYPDNNGYPQQSSLGFAEFPNRLNVALSRAKRLLIIVGNSTHFCQHDCYRRVFEQVQELGAVIDYKTLDRYL